VRQLQGGAPSSPESAPNAERYDDYHLLDNKAVKAVVITTPTFQHRRLHRRAASRQARLSGRANGPHRRRPELAKPVATQIFRWDSSSANPQHHHVLAFRTGACAPEAATANAQ
jgi:hypothetical protein